VGVSLFHLRTAASARPDYFFSDPEVKEVRMSEKLDNVRRELHAKLNEAEKHLKDIEANAKSTNEKAKAQLQAQLKSVETKVNDAKARAAAADARMKSWVNEKKEMTQDAIAQWKSQRNAMKLAGRADRSEDYAVAAIQFAGVAIDEAEKAVIEAVVARMDADAVAP
jgi:chromosome segregation ATPase